MTEAILDNQQVTSSLISRGTLWSYEIVIHKLPAKGYEAMQARVRTNTVESLIFINKHAK